MNLGENKGMVADMNVTPMIDILLVLIIVFMIIQTSANTTGLEALLPHPPEKAEETTHTIVVQIIDTGIGRPHLMINQEPVEWDALRSRLVDIYKTRAERVMFAKADPNISFEEVANVIDTADGAFQDMKIGLITT